MTVYWMWLRIVRYDISLEKLNKGFAIKPLMTINLLLSIRDSLVLLENLVNR